ncbi:MAG TPA: ABC transporter substrate-binding protein, partial [Planctomycetota bacterium]|nr:ABC transporter substrate-binding protein [Planctomycetota bacterium]
KILVPVVSTSRAPSVTQTGSPWVVRVVPRGEAEDAGLVPPDFRADAPEAAAFVAAFRARHGRAPGPWAAAGHDAARAIAAGLVAARGRGGVDLRDALRGLVLVPGAAGCFDVDRRGERVPSIRGPAGVAVRAALAIVDAVAPSTLLGAVP